MKIDLLEIKGFGKLKKQAIGLDKGLNLVYGKNEAGKSTMQEFIKAMFFSNSSLKASDYVRRYKPWDAEVFGGNLHYTLDAGQRYRIERNFNNSYLKIFDAGYNDISGLFDIRKDRPGVFAKEHLGVDEDFFEKTVFVRQTRSKLSSSSRKALVESAVNMFQTGMEEVSVGKVIDELNDILKKHVGNNRTKVKPLDEVLQRLDRLDLEEKRLLDERNNVLNGISRNELKEKIQRLDYEYKLIDMAKELLEKRKELDILYEKKDSLKLSLNSVSQQQDVEDEMKVKNDKYFVELKNELKFLNKSLEEKNQQLENLELELEAHRHFMKNVQKYKDDIETLLQDPSQMEGVNKNKKLKKVRFNNNPLRKIISNMDIVLGLASFGILYYVMGSFGVENFMLLSLMGAVVVYFTLNKLKEKIKNKLFENSKHEELEENGLEEFLDKLGVQNISEYYNKINQYDVKILKFERLNDEIVETELRIGKVERLLENFNKKEDEDEDNKQDSFDLLAPKELMQRVESIEAKIKNQEESFFEGVDYLKDKCVFEGLLPDKDQDLLHKEASKESILEVIDIMTKAVNELDKEVILLERETQNALKDVEEIDIFLKNVAQKRLDLEREKTRLKDINDSVAFAMEHIKDAGQGVKNKTLPYLSGNFGQISKRVTGGKYEQLKLDDKFNVKAIEPAIESIVDVALLSGGALEQIYLALRLSIADSITRGKEALPIILDEVFAYYDDERTFESYKMLKDFYDDKQIVLFTCKSREIEIAQEVFGQAMNLIEI